MPEKELFEIGILLLINHETADKLPESGLNQIIIPPDATDQASYEEYRIGDKLDEVLDGIRNLLDARKISKFICHS